MNKNDLQEKYPLHKVEYEPQKNCRACGGTGEVINPTYGTTVCVCTCVGLDDIGGIFKEHVGRELKRMRGQ